MDWRREAVRQAALAGEMRMELMGRLESVRRRKRMAQESCRLEDNELDRQLLAWQIGKLEKEEAWLEGALGKGRGCRDQGKLWLL